MAKQGQRQQLLRQTALLSLGTYVEYLLGMVASIILARYLGPANFGIYGLAIWIAVFARMLINSGVTLGVTRFIAAAGGNEAMPTSRRVQRYFFGVHLLKVTGFVVLCGLALPYLQRHILPTVPIEALYLVLAAVFFRTTYMYFIAVAKGLQDYGSVAIINASGAIVNLTLVAIGVWYGLDVIGFVAIFGVAGIAFCLAAVVRMRPILFGPMDATIEDETQQKISRHLRIVTASLVIGYFASKEIEILLLGWLGQAEQVGYFKVALTLSAGLVLLVPGIFSGVLLPMMARSLEESRETAGRRLVISTRYLLLLSTPLLAYCAGYGERLVVLVYGVDYAPAAWPFVVCVLAAAADTVVGGAQSYLLSSERQAVILRLVIGATIVKAIMAPLAIMQFGLMGAVGTFAIVKMGVVSIKFWVAMSDLDIRFPFVEFAKITVASLLSLALAMLAQSIPWSFIALGVAAGIMALTFALLSLALGCWSRDDIRFFGSLVEKLPAILGRPAGKLLDWSAQRRLAAV